MFSATAAAVNIFSSINTHLDGPSSGLHWIDTQYPRHTRYSNTYIDPPFLFHPKVMQMFHAICAIHGVFGLFSPRPSTAPPVDSSINRSPHALRRPAGAEPSRVTELRMTSGTADDLFGCGHKICSSCRVAARPNTCGERMDMDGMAWVRSLPFRSTVAF